jgi:hypothetical protein
MNSVSKVRNFVTFNANFVDDSTWTEAGDPLIPRGRAVAQAISKGLSNSSLCCSGPEQHSFYGWAFYVNAGSQFRCVIQYVEPWLLICDPLLTVGDRLFPWRYRREHRRILEALATTLAQDPRFGCVTWHTRQEYESSSQLRGESAR